MNFLEINLNLINEIQNFRKEVKSGMISPDSYMIQMGGIAQLGKAMDRHIKFLRAEKDMKISLSDVGPDLIGYNPENEEIECPDQRATTRQECLDYSGSHMETCESCSRFGPTRRALLPET